MRPLPAAATAAAAATTAAAPPAAVAAAAAVRLADAGHLSLCVEVWEVEALLLFHRSARWDMPNTFTGLWDMRFASNTLVA